MHGIEYPPKNSQIFVENAHYPDATPLNISIFSFNPSLLWAETKISKNSDILLMK